MYFFFSLEKGAILFINLAALQEFEESLYLVCIFPEAVEHTVVSSESLKHIGRDDVIGCLFRNLQQQTTVTQDLTERQTEFSFQMKKKSFSNNFQNFIFTCLMRTTTPCSRLVSLLDIHLLLSSRALETFS